MPEEADSLVARLIGGEAEAWPALWRLVEPRLLALLRQPHFLGALSRREDDCRNIVVAVMERLQENDHARLRLYAESKPHKPGIVFMAWLIVVAKRVAIDYMRAHEEYIDRRNEEGASSPGAWRALDTLIVDSRQPGARPSITAEATVHEILDGARALPEGQRDALAGWLAGNDFTEIAAAQKLASARDAERAVRAALQALRRRFRPEDAV